jgi:hypothetical protein
MTLDRPVKWVASRSEDMVSLVHGRDYVMTARLGVDNISKYAHNLTFGEVSHIDLDGEKAEPYAEDDAPAPGKLALRLADDRSDLRVGAEVGLLLHAHVDELLREGDDAVQDRLEGLALRAERVEDAARLVRLAWPTV